VIHRLTEKSIEERVWETLKLKKALFTGLFDEMKDEISFEKLGRKNMMHVIEEVFSDQPGRPKAVLTPEAPQPVAVTKAKRNGKAVANDGYARGGPTPPSRVDRTMPVAQNATQDSYAHSGSFVPGAGQAVAKFLEAGLTLLESLSSSRSADRSGLIERSLSTFLWTDSREGDYRIFRQFGQPVLIRECAADNPGASTLEARPGIDAHGGAGEVGLNPILFT
jgi:hypothetical protein